MNDAITSVKHSGITRGVQGPAVFVVTSPRANCAGSRCARVTRDCAERRGERAGISRVEEKDLVIGEMLAQGRQIGAHEGYAERHVFEELRGQRKSVQPCREVGDHPDGCGAKLAQDMGLRKKAATELEPVSEPEFIRASAD